MKKVIKIVIALFVFVFSFYLSESLNVKDSGENTEDILDFFEFEQAVMDLNENIEFNDLGGEKIIPLSSGGNEEIFNDSNEFVLKRLIVSGNIEENYDATRVISYGDLHVLCYRTEVETEYAYKMFKRNTSLEVFADEIHTIEDYAEKDYNYSSYDSWGAEAIDVGGYTEFLVDNGVSKEVVVVVLDTGINTSHELFEGRLLKDEYGKVKGFSYYDSQYRYSYNNLSFDVDDTSTKDVNEGDSTKYSFEDDNGHGTHVAGIICDLTPSNVKILPIKIGNKKGYSSNTIFLSAYLRVIQIYSKQYNIVATNLSFSGGGKSSEDEKNTFNQKCYEPLLALKILPITAAGNDSEEINIEGLKAVVVSALKRQDGLYLFDKSYSNYGKIIDISAPGTNILSAWIEDKDKAGSPTVSKNGTSMASPAVAAVVALLYLNPNLPIDFTAEDIEQMLYDNCLDAGELGKDVYYGEGFLNLKYFEVEKTATLSFYKDDKLINSYVDHENFIDGFSLKMECSDPSFDIIYTINKTLPTLSEHTKYVNPFYITDTVEIVAMGIKIVNNEIVERTNVYYISYFYSMSAIEDYFTVSSRGYLDNYTGNFSTLVIPETMHGRTIVGLEPSLFKDSNIEYITLPQSVNTMGGYVFQGASKLKYVYAPAVSKIYISAFGGCESLKVVSGDHPSSVGGVEGAYFPSLVETVGFSFSNCVNLETVSLPNLTTLGDDGYDFYNCINLKNIYLPSITSISEGAFYNCESLESIFIIGENVESIAQSSFKGTKIKGFAVDSSNKYFYTDGVGLYSKTEFVSYASGSQNEDYEILESVTIDGEKHNITTIGQSVMSDMKIDELTIPKYIVYMNKFAFNNTEINTLYFNANNSLYEGYYDKEEMMRAAVFYKINTIVIGENVVNVPERLFQDVYFDNLVINSYSTVLDSASFYRMEEQGDIKNLILNFDSKIDSTYMDMIDSSHLLVYTSVDYIYCRAENDLTRFFKFRNHKYMSRQGEYYVYSKEPLVQQISIVGTAYGEGKITPEGTVVLDTGLSQTYTFIPNDGYFVKSIIVDGISLSEEALLDAIKNGYTFKNVEANHTIEVFFAPKVYNILYKNINGEVLNGLQPTSYAYGYSVELPVLQSEDGYYFVGWVDSSNVVVTKILKGDKGDKIFYATFAKKQYDISIEYLLDNRVVSKHNFKVDHGATESLILDSISGMKVVRIFVNAKEMDKDIIDAIKNEGFIFNDIKENIDIDVILESKKHAIVATYEGEGRINPTGEVLVNHGDSKRFIFIPKEGYEVKNIIVDGVELAGEELLNSIYGGYTFENVLDEHSIEVVFAKKVYTIKVVFKGYCKECLSNEIEVEYGENKRLDFIESTDNFVSEVIVDDQTIGSSLSYEFVGVKTDHIVEVIYKKKKFNIVVEVSGNGTFETLNSINNIEYGEDVYINFIADKGYQIGNVLIDNQSVSVENGMLKILNVKSNISVSVSFEKITSEDKSVQDEVEQVGLSCSRGESEGSVFDFLFIMISIFAFVVPKRRLLK